MLKAATTATHTPPKLIGIIFEMDIPIKVEYSTAMKSIQITIMSNLPNRLSKLSIRDEVDLEGNSIEFGTITEIEQGGIITIRVTTEWVALHRLEVGTKMELTGL